jgi:hypothetical protein
MIPPGPQFQITKHLNLAVLAQGAKFFWRCFEFEALKVELASQRTGGFIIPLGPRLQITKHLNLALLAQGAKFFVGVWNWRL